MSYQSGDGEIHNVALPDTSDDSIEQSSREAPAPKSGPTETIVPSDPSKPAASTEHSPIVRPFSSGGGLWTPRPSLSGESFTSITYPPLIRSSATDEPILSLPAGDQFIATGPSTTDDLLSTEQPEPTADAAPKVQSTGNSTSKIPTYIHPVSQGGSVTWKDHNDLVYQRGKDRGQRAPAPILPEGYKSKGPLQNFDFDKLRQSRGRNAPVRKFQDEYEGKKDETPTVLVTEILEYYVGNEDGHLAKLLEKASEKQALNYKIRAQELEIKALRESRAQTVGAMEQEKKLTELSETIKDKEKTIKSLTGELTELKDGTYAMDGPENVECIRRLMARIIQLEEWHKPDSAQQDDRFNDLLIDVRNTEDTINDLFFTIKSLEDALRMRRRSLTTREDPNNDNQDKMFRDVLTTIDELNDTILRGQGESPNPSQDPDSSKQQKRIDELVEDVMGKAIMIKELQIRTNQLAEINRNLQGKQLSSRDPERAEREERIQQLEQDIGSKNETIIELEDRIRVFEEAKLDLVESEPDEDLIVTDRSQLKIQVKELSKLLKQKETAITGLLKWNQKLEAASSIERETSSTPLQDQERQDLINNLTNRNQELEEAERARQIVSAAILPRTQRITEMIKTAKEINDINFESQARIILLKAQSHLNERQLPAAANEAMRAEAIIRSKLPHLNVLLGKAIYLHGKAAYENRLLPEAIMDLEDAVQMGFDKNCKEVDGDCVVPLLIKARKAQRGAEGGGYPNGADLESEI